MLEIFLVLHGRFNVSICYEYDLSVCNSNDSTGLREYAESMHRLIENNFKCRTSGEKCLSLQAVSEIFEKIFFQKIGEWDMKRHKEKQAQPKGVCDPQKAGHL